MLSCKLSDYFRKILFEGCLQIFDNKLQGQTKNDILRAALHTANPQHPTVTAEKHHFIAHLVAILWWCYPHTDRFVLKYTDKAMKILMNLSRYWEKAHKSLKYSFSFSFFFLTRWKCEKQKWKLMRCLIGQPSNR